jgi:protein-tyrosine phosphatase
VLAHPERNREFQQNPKRLQNLVDEGVIVQIAAGSLTGLNGNGARRAAEQFIRRGIAHVVASEMHTRSDPRSPVLSDAFDIVSELVDEREAIDLFEINPDMILEGRSPQRERAATLRIRRNWIRVPKIEFNVPVPVPERTRRRWQRTMRRIKRLTSRG